MNAKEKLFLPLIIFVVSVLALYAATHADVYEWDEARHGVNAFEMLRNGDYINLYYGGELDTWNAKPPLMIWLIVLCYKIFGLGLLALRLPSVVATVLFFVVFYRLVALLENRLIAFLTCMLLISCKAVLGWHVGITGDYDALLLLWLTLSAYYFVRFAELGEKNAVYLVALFTGLAFYTKGTAAFVYLPGFVIYAWLRGKGGFLFKNYRTWLAALILTGIIGSWVWLIAAYGKTSDHSVYGSKNALETLLVHDTYRRMASTDFETPDKFKPDRFFVFHVLDSRMNLWNYLFYLSLAIGIFLLVKHRQSILSYIRQLPHRLVVLSVSLTLPLALVLTFAQNTHDWYMAPVFGFWAYLTAKGILYMGSKWKPVFYMAAGLFVFSFARHAHYLYTLPDDLNNTFTKSNEIFRDNDYLIATQTPQHFVLYFHWLGLGFNRPDGLERIEQHSGKLLLLQQAELDETVSPKITPLRYFDKYVLAEIK